MLLDTPPGQQPTSMIPMAIAVLYGAKAGTWLKSHESENATKGMMVN